MVLIGTDLNQLNFGLFGAHYLVLMNHTSPEQSLSSYQFEIQLVRPSPWMCHLHAALDTIAHTPALLRTDVSASLAWSCHFQVMHWHPMVPRSGVSTLVRDVLASLLSRIRKGEGKAQYHPKVI